MVDTKHEILIMCYFRTVQSANVSCKCQKECLQIIHNISNVLYHNRFSVDLVILLSTYMLFHFYEPYYGNQKSTKQ